MTAIENPAVTRFRRYLQIKTVQPNPDYEGAVKFLKQQAAEVSLQFSAIEVSPGRPVVLMTWKGEDPHLPSILLNSHTDVVPVYPEMWTYDPFEAVKTENGNIYARGSQDMKCVGMQYLEAIRKLKEKGKRLRRTVHLSFVPDEEIGGELGMKKFIETTHFKELKVGFALDEGLASPKKHFSVFYGERLTWWLKVSCSGNPGHGSQFIENTAAEKLNKVINSFLEFRDQEKKKLKENEHFSIGDVTTVNLTKLEGGVQANVVPAEMTAVFDIRITPTVNVKEFENKIENWIKSAGYGVKYSFLQKSNPAALTPITKSDPWFSAFSSACEEMNLETKCEIFPAATDSRYLRELGCPALGFSPMNNTPILLHDHNEFLNEKVFLQGIDIYCSIISAIANVPPQN